jgi:hypothetical protein
MRCRKPDDGFIDLRESEKFLVLPGRRLVAGRASIMEPNVAFGQNFREEHGKRLRDGPPLRLP